MRSKSTWTTITTSGLTWAWACAPLYYLLVAFDMGDTQDLTSCEICGIMVYWVDRNAANRFLWSGSNT